MTGKRTIFEKPHKTAQVHMKYTLLFAGLVAVSGVVKAQDSARKKEVNITSTFKPSLKQAAKININAAPPSTDTTRPRLQYTIPNQNLNFAFQPGSLKPMALHVDSGGKWDNESYVKVGYGNLSTPFIQAGISLGDGKTAGLNIYAKHVSSKGKLDYQDFTNSSVDLNAFLRSGKNIEWDARFGGFQERYNKYGFQPSTLVFPEDSLAVKFQTWRGRLSFHNIDRTELGISYSPEIKVDVFSDQLSNSESNTYLNVPLQKTLGSMFEVDVALTAGLSRYKQGIKSAIANNYFMITPAVIFKKQNVLFHAGLRPSWNNSDFSVLPDVFAEFNTNNKRLAIQFGWLGTFRTSGYQYLAGMNPWVFAPSEVHNSRIEERFLGLKGSIGDHFSYSAKLASNKINNQPLFINDTASGKSFIPVNESELKVISLGGELGYTVGERFSVISNLTVNNFNTKDNEKAWGFLPIEWKTDMKLQVMKDLYVNTTLYAFDGPWSLTKSSRTNLGSAMDLSAGLEFRVVKNVKLWAQFNNIFNKSYQRWNQYPVYGFNFLGGVVFSFAQKNTSADSSN
jgi:hypothetical protein